MYKTGEIDFSGFSELNWWLLLSGILPNSVRTDDNSEHSPQESIWRRTW
jgi:hypothetical protein